MQSKVEVSVILMAHNEESTIKKEVESYYKHIVKKFKNAELIIAEDGSTDKTREILKQIAIKNRIIPLPPSSRKKYAGSLRAAMEIAKGSLIFYADSGLKHNPKDFWKLYKKMDIYDFISGVKQKRADGWYRKVLGWGLNTMVNLYFNVDFHDIDCGFKLFNSKTKKVLLSNEWILKNNISMEISLRVAQSGLRYGEIAIQHTARKDGPSRGLPVKKIPGVVVYVLLMMPLLKRRLQRR